MMLTTAVDHVPQPVVGRIGPGLDDCPARPAAMGQLERPQTALGRLGGMAQVGRCAADRLSRAAEPRETDLIRATDDMHCGLHGWRQREKAREP